MLSPGDLAEIAKLLMETRQAEKPRLDRLLAYRKDGCEPDGGVLSRSNIAGLPSGLPDEVYRLARISRVNVVRYIVSARVQHMYVDGFQTTDTPDNVPAWNIWQRNRLDARQAGVHRAALTFGAAYALVMPGKPVPVIRGLSPRDLTALYAKGEDWPVAALQRLGGGQWRILDSTTAHYFRGEDGSALTPTGKTEDHGMMADGAPVVPVVKFRDVEDLDVDVQGIVEPFVPLQEQINVTTFGLQVAQHYGAFRQRYILGWIAESEAAALKTGASRLMMFEDSPQDVKVGEFSQTDLQGYISSREATLRHLATVSQTPVHELLGQFVNLSADALEAARASAIAAIEENRQVAGEAWEQVLNLAGEAAGERPDPSAFVIWRDTRVRSMSEAATALGALASQLGVPPRALWSRIPGVSQHELETWATLADEGDSLGNLAAMLNQQAAPPGGANG